MTIRCHVARSEKGEEEAVFQRRPAKVQGRLHGKNGLSLSPANSSRGHSQGRRRQRITPMPLTSDVLAAALGWHAHDFKFQNRSAIATCNGAYAHSEGVCTMKMEKAVTEGIPLSANREDNTSVIFTNQSSLGRLLLTVEQTAELLSISPFTIYCKIGRRAKKKFEIKPIRIGGSIRFDVRDIESFLNSQKSSSE